MQVMVTLPTLRNLSPGEIGKIQGILVNCPGLEVGRYAYFLLGVWLARLAWTVNPLITICTTGDCRIFEQNLALVTSFFCGWYAQPYIVICTALKSWAPKDSALRFNTERDPPNTLINHKPQNHSNYLTVIQIIQLTELLSGFHTEVGEPRDSPPPPQKIQ